MIWFRFSVRNQVMETQSRSCERGCSRSSQWHSAWVFLTSALVWGLLLTGDTSPSCRRTEGGVLGERSGCIIARDTTHEETSSQWRKGNCDEWAGSDFVRGKYKNVIDNKTGLTNAVEAKHTSARKAGQGCWQRLETQPSSSRSTNMTESNIRFCWGSLLWPCFGTCCWATFWKWDTEKVETLA